MLTRSGLGAVLTALVLAGSGWWWGYEELVIAAVVIGGVMLIAIWVSQRPLRATVTRRLVAARVSRGDPIRLVYRLHNPTRFRSGRATIIDRCDGAGDACHDRIGARPFGDRCRRCDPDEATGHLRRRPARHRADRPLLAHRSARGARTRRRRCWCTRRCTTWSVPRAPCARSRASRSCGGPPPIRCRDSSRCASTSRATTHG